MWYRFVLLPSWAHFLVFVLLFGLTGLVPRLMSGQVFASDVELFYWGFVAVFTLVLGAVATFSMRRGARLLREPLAGVPPADYSKVAKALRTGPVPSDPVVRRAALVLARRSGEKLEKNRPVMIGLLLVCSVLEAVSAVGSSSAGTTAGRLACVALFMGLIVHYWLYPKRLRARTQLLEAAENASASPAPAITYPAAAHPYWSDRAAGTRHEPPL